MPQWSMIFTSSLSSEMKKTFPVLLLALLLGACGEKYTGFTELDNGIFRKLHTFGDCEGDLAHADFSGINIFLAPADDYDSVRYFQVFNGKLEMNPDYGASIDGSLFEEISRAGCGDSVSFIVPYSSFDSTFIDQYDGKLYLPEAMVRLTVKVRSVFDEKSFFEYASVMSQQGKMDENFILEFALMNREAKVEKHGDVYIERLEPATGDTLRAGNETSIEYQSFLLDGTPIDSLTSMTFSFGRPGQLIDGFQFGLSKMSEGEKAKIYVPSYLAFGEDGSSSGLIPPRTPLCFEVKIISIGKPN